MLTLSEELYLALHFNKKKATLDLLPENMSQLIAAGGMVVELLLAGRLRLDETRLAVVDTSLTGDELLDETLTCLQAGVSLNPDDPEWFSAIASKTVLSKHLLARLIEKDVIRPFQERKWFGLSQVTVYPLQDRNILERWQWLQRDILLNNKQPTAHDAILLFMTTACDEPLPNEFSRREQKAADARWRKLFGDFWGAYPVQAASEPVPGINPSVRKAIGELIVSWGTVKSTYDVSRYASH